MRKCWKCGCYFDSFEVNNCGKICRACQNRIERETWEGSEEQYKRILEVYGKNKKGLHNALHDWRKARDRKKDHP